MGMFERVRERERIRVAPRPVCPTPVITSAAQAASVITINGTDFGGTKSFGTAEFKVGTWYNIHGGTWNDTQITGDVVGQVTHVRMTNGCGEASNEYDFAPEGFIRRIGQRVIRRLRRRRKPLVRV